MADKVTISDEELLPTLHAWWAAMQWGMDLPGDENSEPHDPEAVEEYTNGLRVAIAHFLENPPQSAIDWASQPSATLPEIPRQMVELALVRIAAALRTP